MLLNMRVMADVNPKKVNAVYLLGETIDNAPSVLQKGAELWRKGLVPLIAIQRGAENNGYYGYENSVRDLIACGIPRDMIVPVQFLKEYEDAGQIHTLTELMGLARLAKKKGWKRLTIVAPAFHQLRSFMTAVTALDREYPELEVYNCVGVHLPWGEKVKHSQGTTVGIRSDLVAGEIKRILAYQQTGTPYPLVSVEQALKYLDWRYAA